MTSFTHYLQTCNWWGVPLQRQAIEAPHADCVDLGLKGCNVLNVQKHNEEKLNEAFAQKCGVYLIFSVNMSGHFQGYARMMSYVSRQQVGMPLLKGRQVGSSSNLHNGE